MKEIQHGFFRHGSNAYLANFSEAEREVLTNLVEQIIELLAERVDHHNDDPLAAMVGITMHDTPPDDEVLLRLLPNAYADQVDASEFRRYTESTLRQKKQAHAMAMRMHLKSAVDGIVEVDHDGANAWLGAMNDVRLALGVRLNVQENSHEDLELLAPDDPMRGVYAVYSWLGWLQESLISALMDESEQSIGSRQASPVSDAPIGIFDSGVGGLTVARAILDQLPNESTLYIGDTARGPYGPRPLAEVREFALETMDFLVEQGVKAIVIACNTASAAILRDARERYSIPVIEVIQPAVRRAVAATRTGNIGVIGTRATIDSKAYVDAFAAAPQLKITSIACPLFVEYVERGETSGADITKVARDYLAPVMDAHVDTLVLGCTHYPLLTGVISYVMGEGVTLVSSAEETAKDLYRTLVENGLLSTQSSTPATHRFLATGDAKAFESLARRFLGPEVTQVEHKEL